MNSGITAVPAPPPRPFSLPFWLQIVSILAEKWAANLRSSQQRGGQEKALTKPVQPNSTPRCSFEDRLELAKTKGVCVCAILPLKLTRAGVFFTSLASAKGFLVFVHICCGSTFAQLFADDNDDCFCTKHHTEHRFCNTFRTPNAGTRCRCSEVYS